MKKILSFLYYTLHCITYYDAMSESTKPTTRKIEFPATMTLRLTKKSDRRMRTAARKRKTTRSILAREVIDAALDELEKENL